MKIVDLSHTIDENTKLYPGSPENRITQLNDFEQDGFRESQYLLSSHTATHIDTTAHILNDGKYLHELPASNFCGNGFVMNASKNHANIIDESEIEKFPKINKVDFILIYTGWDKMWTKNEYFKDFIYPSETLALKLKSMNLKGVGIDGPSFDNINSTELPVHNILMEAGLILVENLCNLGKLLNKNFLFTCFPLKIVNGEASPVRAVAIINE